MADSYMYSKHKFKDKVKDKIKNKVKDKTKRNNKKKKFKRTLKDKYEEEVVDLPNIHKVENSHYHLVERNGSYSPEINKEIQQQITGEVCDLFIDINFEDYYSTGKPLMLYDSNEVDFQDRYKPYDSVEYRSLLIERLDFEFDVDKIIPPNQNDSNCWFNSMFMTLFVSDKGRKFFKFFRYLMIEGKQSLGIEIPEGLKIAFAYLNYAIDACLTGNCSMYDLDTNNIIKRVYENIPIENKSEWIRDVGEDGNPIAYYMDIMNYLKNNTLYYFYIFDINCKWKDKLHQEFLQNDEIPEIIIMDFSQNNHCTNKPVTFKINHIKYILDSICILDVEENHFCTLLTCDGKDYFYDGFNKTKLIPFEWKKKINKDYSWVSNSLQYNCMKSYQTYIYYRVTK